MSFSCEDIKDIESRIIDEGKFVYFYGLADPIREVLLNIVNKYGIVSKDVEVLIKAISEEIETYVKGYLHC